jgi:hypothetical protein
MSKRSSLRAVMLDCAGTTVDHGSMPPLFALQTLFAKHGISLSNEDARRDMVLLKRDQIQAILLLPNVGTVRQQRLKETEETMRSGGVDFIAEDLPSHSLILSLIEQNLADGCPPPGITISSRIKEASPSSAIQPNPDKERPVSKERTPRGGRSGLSRSMRCIRSKNGDAKWVH